METIIDALKCIFPADQWFNHAIIYCHTQKMTGELQAYFKETDRECEIALENTSILETVTSLCWEDCVCGICKL